MIRSVIALALFALALAGCTSSRREPETATAAPAVAPATTTLPFWAPEDAPLADIHEHPCGAYVMRAVDRLPLDDSGPLGVDWIVEFSADGRELAHWPTPVDFLPEGIDGNRLLIADNKQAFWVETDGAFRSTPVVRQTSGLIDCPTLERFADSDYLQCTSFRDGSTGKTRYIAFQGVCT